MRSNLLVLENDFQLRYSGTIKSFTIKCNSFDLFLKPMNKLTHSHDIKAFNKNDVWLLSSGRSFPFSPWPLFHLVFWFTSVVWSVLVQWNYWIVSTIPVSWTHTNTLKNTKYPNVFCPLSIQTVWLELHQSAISCECSVPLKQLSIILLGVAGV